MLLTAIIDPCFKNLTLRQYTETKQEALKKGIVGLMEMYKGQEEHGLRAFSIRCKATKED